MDRTVLTLVRHGETPANVEGVWHGSIDTPLTPLGHSQAERVAHELSRETRPAAALYSSPLLRARTTAAAIGKALALETRVEADIAEYHLGSWEGLSYRRLVRQHRLFDHMSEDPDFRPGDGESPREVATRCSGALQRIASQHRGERVVVVAHGGALALGLGLLLDDDPGTWRLLMKNCAVSDLTLEPEPELLRWNHTAHLEPDDPGGDP